MTIPKVHLKNDPFPHAIIENFYSEQELNLIWKEINFLTSANKFVPSKEIGADYDGANSNGVVLNNIYTDKKYSDILTISDKIFNPDLIKALKTLHPFINSLDFINFTSTKIKYYENNDFHVKHLDTARFSIVTYLYKEPKQFEGGELYFDDFDYTIPIENNKTIFFVSCLNHSVKKITMQENIKFSGNGKYSIVKFLEVKN